MIIHNHEYLMWLVFTISVLGFLVFVFDSSQESLPSLLIICSVSLNCI